MRHLELTRARTTLTTLTTLTITALLLGPGGFARVAAHGPVPAALSIVDEDATGPRLVRLNGGLALRESPERFRFVCPAAWGDEVVLPAARITGGPAVMAGGRGLFLIDTSGRATPHPDPNAAGASTDFATLGDMLYVLRSAMGTTEVLEVDATRVRAVFSEPGSWTTIAATAEALGLQRLRERRIEQLRLAADGSVIDRVSAPEPDDSILVLARATSHELYAVLTTPGGRELGKIETDRWVRLEAAVASIAGPVEAPDGVSFVAIDTELMRLPEPRGMLQGLLPVSCLGRLGDVAYACTRAGLSSLSDSGLAGPIFELSSLQPPELASIDEAQREMCELQWEHFRFDLLSLGIPLTEPPVVPAAGAGGSTAGPKSAADGGDAEADQESDGGCAVARPGSAPWPLAWLGLVAFGLVARCRRRSRERNRSVEQAP
jgi:hypothetical protein